MVAKLNVFDRVLKVLARQYAARFLELALPSLPLLIVDTLENVELSIPEERVDFVHRVAYGEQEYALHIEFQTKHQADVPQRLFVYSALLTRQLGLPVLTLVFYLTRRAAPVPDAYQVQVGGIAVNRFEYPVIKLWEYADEIAQGRWPELAPLLVTLKEGEPDPAVLGQERELILQEPDLSKRADLLACAVTIAARYFDKAFLWQFFREEVEMIREATFIEEWLDERLEEGRQQGLRQGLEQGLEQAHLADLLRILLWRFGKLPVTVEEQLKSLTTEQLDSLLNEALKAPNLDEFQAVLGHVTSS